MHPVTDQNTAGGDPQCGWDIAIRAVRFWQEEQAMVKSRRSQSPKNLEREANVRTRWAEQVATLFPDDA